MKKTILFVLLALASSSCERGGGGSGSEYCTYNGHTLYVGEKGGCYYLSSGGNKEYVDKSYCVGCN
ncbi:hypothetical protein SAMN05421639_102414 [Chryseobacterium shigense]|uniref:Lipoprotein n=1 Tax=Chryseobacterium shigense TaxID=297244 RepID=A0A1N7I744_9FLAO|nr:hypothetical protein [Chryseobacterium shigense]SIS32897.1 hypothetical protein SAMN05421639_102414 [Chryseobacterium shigense]